MERIPFPRGCPVRPTPENRAGRRWIDTMKCEWTGVAAVQTWPEFDWYDPDNWADGLVPGNGDDVIFRHQPMNDIGEVINVAFRIGDMIPAGIILHSVTVI